MALSITDICENTKVITCVSKSYSSTKYYNPGFGSYDTVISFYQVVQKSHLREP